MRQPGAAAASVVFFDIDGTLVTDTSSSSFLAHRLGHATEVDRAEAGYAAGTIDNHEVCLIDARGWAGVTELVVDTWLRELPLIGGIEETVAWCCSQGIIPAVASLAWDPVARILSSVSDSALTAVHVSRPKTGATPAG